MKAKIRTGYLRYLIYDVREQYTSEEQFASYDPDDFPHDMVIHSRSLVTMIPAELLTPVAYKELIVAGELEQPYIEVTTRNIGQTVINIVNEILKAANVSGLPIPIVLHGFEDTQEYHERDDSKEIIGLVLSLIYARLSLSVNASEELIVDQRKVSQEFYHEQAN